MEQDESADFVLLIADEHIELTGVDACMGWLYSRDHQFPSVLVKGTPSTSLNARGAGVLQSNKPRHSGGRLKALIAMANE